MSYYTSLSKMIYLDYNLVPRVSHTWTTSFTTQSGNGPDMLSDDDATSLCKSSGSLTTPTIEVEWGSSQFVTAWGVCNHNFRTAGVTDIVLEWWDSGGGVWRNVDYPGSAEFSFTGQEDRDFAMVYQSVSSTKHRMRFVQTPTKNIYVGFIFVGTFAGFARNPSSYVHRQRSGTKYIQSAGGTNHAVLGPAYKQRELEMNWDRATLSDLKNLMGFNLTRNDYITCVIPPEASPNPLLQTAGQEVFFGRVEEIQTEPLTPSNVVNGNERYNIFVSMKGAV